MSDIRTAMTGEKKSNVNVYVIYIHAICILMQAGGLTAAKTWPSSKDNSTVKSPVGLFTVQLDFSQWHLGHLKGVNNISRVKKHSALKDNVHVIGKQHRREPLKRCGNWSPLISLRATGHPLLHHVRNHENKILQPP